MDFSSTNWINPKRSLETQKESYDIFTIPLFLAMVGPSLIFYFRVMLRLQYFYNKS